jgi:hypothetical protein
MRIFSPSLAIKEMKNKARLRFDLTSVRISILKNITNNKCWLGYGEKKASYTSGGNVS